MYSHHIILNNFIKMLQEQTQQNIKQVLNHINALRACSETTGRWSRKILEKYSFRKLAKRSLYLDITIGLR